MRGVPDDRTMDAALLYPTREADREKTGPGTHYLRGMIPPFVKAQRDFFRPSSHGAAQCGARQAQSGGGFGGGLGRAVEPGTIPRNSLEASGLPSSGGMYHRALHPGGTAQGVGPESGPRGVGVHFRSRHHTSNLGFPEMTNPL